MTQPKPEKAAITPSFRLCLLGDDPLQNLKGTDFRCGADRRRRGPIIDTVYELVAVALEFAFGEPHLSEAFTT